GPGHGGATPSAPGTAPTSPSDPVDRARMHRRGCIRAWWRGSLGEVSPDPDDAVLGVRGDHVPIADPADCDGLHRARRRRPRLSEGFPGAGVPAADGPV